MDNPAVVPPPTVPPSPPPVTPQKSVIPLLPTILFLLALAATIILAIQNWQLNQRLNAITANPNPTLSPVPTAFVDLTSDWKTYTNGNYNYLFKYPNDWPDIPQVLPNQKDGFQLAGQTIYLSQTFPQVRPPQIQIEAFRSEKVLGQDQLEDKESCGAPTFTTSKSSIGGAPAIIGRRLAPRDPSAPYYTGLHYCARTYFNGIIYNFLWEEGTDTDSSLFDQILSTFKFLGQGQSCSSVNLGLSLTLPAQNWQCSVDNLGKEQVHSDGIIALKSPIFTVQISSLGRGAACDLSDPDPSSPRYDPTNACSISEFYSKNDIVLKTYKLSGQTKEIFGQINNGPSVSITYSGMDKRDLTVNEKSELIKLLDSIKITK